jgi:hypothetical protein
MSNGIQHYRRLLPPARVCHYHTMSSAQILYLHNRIWENISQEEESLRKRVGHQILLKQIQPLVVDAKLDICSSRESYKRAMEEATSWLTAARHEIYKSFEDRLMDRAVDVDPTERYRGEVGSASQATVS